MTMEHCRHLLVFYGSWMSDLKPASLIYITSVDGKKKGELMSDRNTRCGHLMEWVVRKLMAENDRSVKIDLCRDLLLTKGFHLLSISPHQMHQ
jgi:hypothetical protein